MTEVPLSTVHLADATVLFDPPGDGEGHWVGAPCVHRHDGTTYLAVRWRDPDRRGYAVAVYERVGRDAFEECARVTADELSVRSVERPALVTDPRTDDLRCYLPVDHGENDWTVQLLDGVAEPSALDPGSARDVLVPEPGGSDAVTVKDPYVLVRDGRYYMFYAGHDGVSEQAHLATSDDGLAWERSPANPLLPRGGWHDHHTRVACAVPTPDASQWTLYYGGSGTEDRGATWNLRTGVAVASGLEAPNDAPIDGIRDVTPDEPILVAPVADACTALDQFGTARYVDVFDGGDRRELFAEVARADGAFDLRRIDLPPHH